MLLPSSFSSCHPRHGRSRYIFIALAKHPEWGNGHTVWAEVVGDDMAVVDAIMRRPLRVANWGSINATELVTPLPFALRDGSAVVES